MDLMEYVKGLFLIIVIQKLGWTTAASYADPSAITISESGGATVILPCIVQNIAVWERVIWQGPLQDYLFVDDQKYSLDMRLSVPMKTPNDYSMWIKNVTALDGGTYTCNVENKVKSITLIVVVSPKIMYPKDNKTMTVYEGDKALLSCKVVGTPLPNVTWFRSFVNTYGTEVSEQLPTTGPQLVLYDIQRESAGTYICEADNGIEPKARRYTEISIHYAPQADIPVKKISQFLGKDTVLSCNVEGNPLEITKWYANGKEVVTTSRHRIELYDDGGDYFTTNLFFKAIKREDFGTYMCYAENELGNSTAFIELRPLGKVKIESITKDLQAVEGETIELDCEAKSKITPQIIWSFSDDEGTQKEVQKGSILTLNTVSRKDSGVYTCVADNGKGFPDSRNVTLDVQYAPSVSVQRIVEVMIGKHAIVECQVSANPQPTMVWTSRRGDNKTFEHTMEIMQLFKHKWSLTMKILKVDSETFGQYECAAENIHGSDMKTTDIIDGFTTTKYFTTTVKKTTQKPIVTPSTSVKKQTTSSQTTSKETSPTEKSHMSKHNKSTGKLLSTEQPVISTRSPVNDSPQTGIEEPSPSGQKIDESGRNLATQFSLNYNTWCLLFITLWYKSL